MSYVILFFYKFETKKERIWVAIKIPYNILGKYYNKTSWNYILQNRIGFEANQNQSIIKQKKKIAKSQTKIKPKFFCPKKTFHFLRSKIKTKTEVLETEIPEKAMRETKKTTSQECKGFLSSGRNWLKNLRLWPSLSQKGSPIFLHK